MGEEHAATNDVSAHISIRSDKNNIRKHFVKPVAELALRIKREAPSRFSKAVLRFF